MSLVESLIEYIDEVYGTTLPNYYKINKDNWEDKCAESIAVNEIKNRLILMYPAKSIEDILVEYLDELDHDFDTVLRYHKDLNNRSNIYEVMYNTVSDILNAFYMFGYEVIYDE